MRELRTVDPLSNRDVSYCETMGHEFPVPDTSSIKQRPADLLIPDRITKMKKCICVTCGGKVEGFDSELSQMEFLISGMSQKCQDSIFGTSEKDLEESNTDDTPMAGSGHRVLNTAYGIIFTNAAAGFPEYSCLRYDAIFAIKPRCFLVYAS